MSARPKNGFTLVELCLVCALLGLVASLAWPSLRTVSQRLQARLDIQRAATQLRLARETAVRLGETQRLILPRTFEAVTFYPDGTATPVETAIKEGETWVRLVVRPTGAVTIYEN